MNDPIQKNSIWRPIGYVLVIGTLLIASNRLIPWDTAISNLTGLERSWATLFRKAFLNTLWGIAILSYVLRKKYLLLDDWHWKGLLYVPFLGVVTYLFTSGFSHFFSIKFGSIDSRLLFIYSWDMLSIGFLEEIFFRGLILSSCLLAFHGQRNFLKRSIYFCAFIFGLMHIINLFSADLGYYSLKQAAYQVVFAAGMGILLAAIYIKSKSIWLVIFLHAFHNWLSGLQVFLPSSSESDAGLLQEAAFDWTQFLFGFLFLSIPLVFGLFLMRFIDEQDERQIADSLAAKHQEKRNKDF